MRGDWTEVGQHRTTNRLKVGKTQEKRKQWLSADLLEDTKRISTQNLSDIDGRVAAFEQCQGKRGEPGDIFQPYGRLFDTIKVRPESHVVDPDEISDIVDVADNGIDGGAIG